MSRVILHCLTLILELAALLRDDPEQETTPHQATEMIAKERITYFFGWVVGSGGKHNIRFCITGVMASMETRQIPWSIIKWTVGSQVDLAASCS